MTPPRLVTALLLALTLSGCSGGGNGGGSGGGDASSPSGPGPLTDAAAAGVVLSTVDVDPSSVSRRTESDGAVVGVELRFTPSGEQTGPLIAVAIFDRPQPDLACAEDDFYAGCRTQRVDGGTATFAWERATPEEDPGVVYAVVQRAAETVVVYYAGTEVTADPTDLSLGIGQSTGETLLEIAQDPRMMLDADAETLALGKGISVGD